MPDNEINTYLEDKEDKWKAPFLELYETVRSHLPPGYEFTFQYGMPSFVVPFTIFPEGYHCEPDTPLPFISIAVQKRHIALYHMGIYGDEELLDWFQREYPKHIKTKLNMGKSCIRFTNPNNIPYDLIGELVGKMLVEQWIDIYKDTRRSE